MSGAAHTPGPWVSGRKHPTCEVYFVDQNIPEKAHQDEIAVLYGHDGEEAIANASLIAAAPDLLAFADAYLAMADEVTNKGANARPTLLQLNLLLAKAREVRAKATGAA